MHHNVLLAFDAICGYCALLDAKDLYVPTGEDAGNFREFAKSFLLAYSDLNTWAESNERRLFPIVSRKLHTFWHMSCWAKYLNPRYTWCFRSEDYVGKISKLAFSVAHGNSSIRMSRRILGKYRHLLHLRLTRALHEDE